MMRVFPAAGKYLAQRRLAAHVEANRAKMAGYRKRREAALLGVLRSKMADDLAVVR